jgi:hypothetical protein
LNEVQICRRAPGISHLLFADDTLLFLQAREQHTQVISRVLRQYENGTGQLINPNKCSLMFSSRCLPEDQDRVKEVLQVTNCAHDEKYLGLPTPEGKMGKDRFKSTKERLSSKFTNWAERYMSGGCKESSY